MKPLLAILIVLLAGCSGTPTTTTTPPCTDCNTPPPPPPVDLTLTDCEYDYFQTMILDADYAAQLVPDVVGEPITGVGGASAGVTAWNCQGGSLSNGTAIGPVMMVTFDIDITAKPLPDAQVAKFNGATFVTDATVAAWLKAAGINATLTPLQATWPAYTVAAYPPARITGPTFDLARPASATNERNGNYTVQKFGANATVPHWIEYAAVTTHGSQVSNAVLTASDPFWANDPQYGMAPHPSGAAQYNQMATTTLRYHTGNVTA